jgi:hypothetical protein
MAPKLTDQERQKIIRYLGDGKSQNWIGKQMKRSPDTVGRIAREEGIQSDNRIPKKAIEAAKVYNEERRLSLIGGGFDKAEYLLEKIEDAGEFQKWTVAMGTLIDKVRLETGEATARTESVDPERRKRLKQNLDELAARRRTS